MTGDGGGCIAIKLFACGPTDPNRQLWCVRLVEESGDSEAPVGPTRETPGL